MSTSSSELGPAVARPRGLSVGLAILLIVAGIVAILAPMIFGLAVTLMIGWILVVGGIVLLLFAWKRIPAGHIVWELLLGFLYVISGFYLIAHPIAGLTSLTLILATYLFLKGTIETIRYLQVRAVHGSGWLIADGIINLIFAVLIWTSWPFSAVWVIGTLVGISILFTGFSRLMLTFQVRRALPV